MKVLSRLKNSKFAKFVSVAALSAMMFVMSALNCFAAEADISSTLSTSFTSLKSEITTYVITILPIALGVVTLFFGIKKAVAFFRSIASKS